MSIFRKIRETIVSKFWYTMIRFGCWFVLKFGSEEAKMCLRMKFDDIFTEDFDTPYDFFDEGYKEAYEMKDRTMWNAVEALENYYKKTSWIEVV